MTGYLDRLVARSAETAPSGLAPRPRSPYEDPPGLDAGFRVVERERVAANTPQAVAAPTAEVAPGRTGEAVVTAGGERAVPGPALAPAHRREAQPDQEERPSVLAEVARVHEVTTRTDTIPVAAAGPLGDPVAAPPGRIDPVDAAVPGPCPGDTPAVASIAAPDRGRAVLSRRAVVTTTSALATPTDPSAAAGDGDDRATDMWPPTASGPLARRVRRDRVAATAAEPVVEVTIGRVEIQAVRDPGPARPAPVPSSAPALSDYLRDRARATGPGR